MNRHQVKDVIELGSGEKYVVETVHDFDDIRSMEAAKVLTDGTISEHYFATLAERDGETKIVRRYRV